MGVHCPCAHNHAWPCQPSPRSTTQHGEDATKCSSTPCEQRLCVVSSEHPLSACSTSSTLPLQTASRLRGKRAPQHRAMLPRLSPGLREAAADSILSEWGTRDGRVDAFWHSVASERSTRLFVELLICPVTFQAETGFFNFFTSHSAKGTLLLFFRATNVRKWTAIASC